MAPLVPDLISENLNFIFAFLIGIGFGAILEQAGFSSSKKLVGLFYGYDFTVLRVFFTAGIVAMIGIMGLNHFGLIDMNLVYINPTFIYSAIIGGLIMGLGFVIGGYCPGTSICAAAIGKIDALIFIGGSILGVFIFAEGYPWLEKIYKAGYLGSPQIFNTLGISRELFAATMVVVATIAFFAVEIVENRVNKKQKPLLKFSKQHLALITTALVLLGGALFFSDKKENLIKLISDSDYIFRQSVDLISPDELSCRLLSGDPKLQFIDFRPQEQFNKLSFPNSYRFEMENLFEKEPVLILRYKHKINIFVAEDELTARKMAFIAGSLGFKRIRVLQGGFREFEKEILNFQAAEKDSEMNEFTSRFRLRASRELPQIMKSGASAAPVKKTMKRALGGC